MGRGKKGGERAGKWKVACLVAHAMEKVSLNTLGVTDGPREAAQNSLLWMLELGYAREKFEMTHAKRYVLYTRMRNCKADTGWLTKSVTISNIMAKSVCVLSERTNNVDQLCL